MGISTLPHTFFYSEETSVGSYIGSDVDILSENIRLFLVGNLNSDNLPKPTGGIELPIPIIQDIQSLDLLPTVHSEFQTKDDLTNYLLTDIGLDSSIIVASSQSKTAVEQAFSDTEEITISRLDRLSQDNQVSTLFSFKVPKLNPEGTCSNLHDLSDRPFNLAIDAYGLNSEQYQQLLAASSTSTATTTVNNPPLTLRLLHLNRLVNLIYSLTQADWIGIYRVIQADNELGLLKEAYLGEPSRAIFPLTQEFTLKSTNSWVGLNGRLRSISNTRVRDEGVSYYECSGSVQSEICIPILKHINNNNNNNNDNNNNNNNEWKVVGIIDLESWNVNHFTPQMIIDVLEVGYSLGNLEEYLNVPKF